MNSSEKENENIEVGELFNNYYTIYEKRNRRLNLEKKWVKEMLERDRYKFIM
jgi:hypothetical protein